MKKKDVIYVAPTSSSSIVPTSVLLDKKYYQVQAAELEMVKQIQAHTSGRGRQCVRPKFMGKAGKRFNGIDHLSALLVAGSGHEVSAIAQLPQTRRDDGNFTSRRHISSVCMS